MPTNTFVTNTLKKTRHAIDLLKSGTFYNCLSKHTLYLITCNDKKCHTQYVGYTRKEPSNNGAIKQPLLEHSTDKKSIVCKHIQEHCDNHNKEKTTINILTQSPTTEPNKEQWLKQEFHWIYVSMAH